MKPYKLMLFFVTTEQLSTLCSLSIIIEYCTYFIQTATSINKYRYWKCIFNLFTSTVNYCTPVTVLYPVKSEETRHTGTRSKYNA